LARKTGANAKGAAKMRLFFESDAITPNINKLPAYVDRVAATTLAYYEPQVENYAKLNAPWQDQTTNARNGLIARSGKEGELHFLVLAHQVPYGIWLEIKYAGKNAIILPTIEEYGPKVMTTLNKILDRFR